MVDKCVSKRYNSFCQFDMQKWRNWQTRRLQVPVAAMSCGFKSHLLHYLIYLEALRITILRLSFFVNGTTFWYD